MANVYYKIDGDNLYYSNNQEEADYALWATGSTVTSGKNVIVILHSQPSYSIELFEFPDEADCLFYGATNTKFENSRNWSTANVTRF